MPRSGWSSYGQFRQTSNYYGDIMISNTIKQLNLLPILSHGQSLSLAVNGHKLLGIQIDLILTHNNLGLYSLNESQGY